MFTVFLISLVVEACIVKDLFEIFTFLPMLTFILDITNTGVCLITEHYEC